MLQCIVQFFRRLFKTFGPRMTPEEHYLRQATSLADLERRMIELHGWHRPRW